ncbi:hypothetical protein JCM11251_003147 [Rhodosporidiobolus azoricus]
MPHLTLSLFAICATASLSVLAQTADEVSTEQLTLSAGIPGQCSTQCSTWLSTLAGCPGPADATYPACVCAADFQTNFAACSACFVAEADVNAATAQDAATDLTNYCATAGTAVVTDTSSTTTSTETTTSSTETTTSSTTTTPPVEVATSSSSSSTPAASDSSSSATDDGVRTIVQSIVNADWPTQTKSSNVFTGGAAGLSVGKTGVVAASLLGMVAGGMMLL